MLTALVVTACGLGLGLLFNSLTAIVGGLVGGAVVMQLCFMRRGWIVLPVAVLVSLATLFVVLTTPSTRDARRAETENLLGAARNQVRVAYTKQGSPADIRTLTEPIGQGGCGVPQADMRGRYFAVRDSVEIEGNTVTLVAENLPGVRNDGACTITFELKGSENTISWSQASVWDTLRNWFVREESRSPPAAKANEPIGARR